MKHYSAFAIRSQVQALRIGAADRLRGLRRERIGKTQFDERLPIDADALRLAVDGVQQVEREIHVHPLDLAPWPARLRHIQIRRQVAGRIIDRQVGQAVELLSGDYGGLSAAPARRSIALFRRRARSGPR